MSRMNGMKISGHDQSESTVDIEFNRSVNEVLYKTYDDITNGSCPSIQNFSLTKRSMSTESLEHEKNRIQVNISSKRSRQGSLDYSKNAKENKSTIDPATDFVLSNDFLDLKTSQQSESTDQFSPAPISLRNEKDLFIAWLKNFIVESVDTIRDAVLQACLTTPTFGRLSSAVSPSIASKYINVNQHGTSILGNDVSLTSSYRSHHRWDKDQPLRLPDYSHFLPQDQKEPIHRRARISPYPVYRNVLRTTVTDYQVPWSYHWPEYRPNSFTAHEIYISPGADPDLQKLSTSMSLRFNEVDGAVDRRSVYRSYQVRTSDHLPLNPIGRTGLEGRGILPRWGPNAYHYVLLCRWKRDKHGRILSHPLTHKRLLQLLLEVQIDYQGLPELILTGGLKMLGCCYPPQLQDRLRRFIILTEKKYGSSQQVSSLTTALENLFDQQPITWKGAYFDDIRNTDNAWIELSIDYYFDSTHQYLSCIPELNEEQLSYLDQPRFIWKDVQRTINIGPRTHYRLIESLVSKLHGHF